MKSIFPERFHSKIEFTDTCWLWKAAISSDYGNYGVGGKQVGAHRYSWELTNGPIPKGLCVLHKCDVPRCVNPEHLFLGTLRENMIDKISKGRGNFSCGEKHRNAKLTRIDVEEIRRTFTKGGKINLKFLSEKYGVSTSTIGMVVQHKAWVTVV